jgi:2,4-dienoyl-CoA reductase-like NADH-dependent reductase (Old Yellow Enzyme family)
MSNLLFEPAMLNGLELKNRFIKAGTFEGKTPKGIPSDKMLAFHKRLAEGGLAMTTLGYCASEADGRLNENMMYMDEYVRRPLTELLDELHAAGTKVSGQLSHSGAFSKNKDLIRRRPRGPQFGLNSLGVAFGMFFCDGMSESDIEELVQSYYDSAVFMKSVGFDCIEIHYGHGYGMCQFMSPRTNKRKDKYGGTLENRMRLPLEVLAAVRKAVGDDFPVIGKISMSEGVRGGISYDDSVEIAKMLDLAGIDGIVTSAGTSTMSPMLMLRGDNILPPMLKAEKNIIMKLILRLIGPAMFKDVEYYENYFLENAKRIREVVKCNMIYIGGASNNESFEELMAAGFDFIQLGRSLLSDPDLPNRAKEKSSYTNNCTHCNECIATIEHADGIHCTQFDAFKK